MYEDATTVAFSYARPSFSVQVYNAGVYYQLGALSPGRRDIDWEVGEHFSGPALLSFRDPAAEGLPPGSQFAAIRFRSSAAGVPAAVTVA